MEGILTKEEQIEFGKKLDNLVDFKKFKGKKIWLNFALTILEKKDEDVFTGLIKFLDDKYGEQIPLDLKPAARAVALAVIRWDVNAFKDSAPKLLDKLADIPRISDETEAIIAKALVVGIVEAFETKLDS